MKNTFLTIVVTQDGPDFEVIENSVWGDKFLGTMHMNDQGISSKPNAGSKYGAVQWQNFERALAYLISPRGMS